MSDAATLLIAQLNNQGSGLVESVNSGTAVTISSPSTAAITVLTLNGATPAITMPTPTVGAIKRLYLLQDATGSRIPTWAGATIKWVGAAAPTLQTAAAGLDRVTFESYDGSHWVGSVSLHIA